MCKNCQPNAETAVMVIVTITNTMELVQTRTNTPIEVNRQAITFQLGQKLVSVPATFGIAEMTEHVELVPVKPSTAYDRFGNLVPAHRVE